MEANSWEFSPWSTNRVKNHRTFEGVTNITVAIIWILRMSLTGIWSRLQHLDQICKTAMNSHLSTIVILIILMRFISLFHWSLLDSSSNNYWIFVCVVCSCSTYVMLNICDVDDDRCRIVEWDGRGNHDCVRCADRAFKHGQKVTRSESKTRSENKVTTRWEGPQSLS